MLQEATGITNVSITDSARCMALAESRYGLGRGIKNFTIVAIGVGLGAGIVIDGKILSGSRGIAGELGHIYVGESASLCCCGNHGCLESLASGWALSRQVSEAMNTGVVTSIERPVEGQGDGLIQSVIEAAKAGDKFAVNMLDEMTDYLSTGISTLINLLSPERIIICGGLAEGAGNLLMRPLIHRTYARSLPWLQKDIDIRLSTLGEYSAAWGAATYAMDKLFETESGSQEIN
jgi:N-acetylglucosamine repressor